MPVDFYIVSAPTHIRFDCPHCGADVRIPWKDVDTPECWVDDWPDVECPDCGKTVQLGGWEYD